MGSIELAAIMPHPPILVPEIGRDRLKEAQKSKKALEELVLLAKAKTYDTIVVISPHGEIGQSSVPVYTGHVFEGSFSMFGQPKPVFSFRGDPELAQNIIRDCSFASTCSASLLDHGALVPLYFLKDIAKKAKVLPIAIAPLPLPKLFEFGQSLNKTIGKSKKKVLLVASADMSHRLTPDAPAGFSPRGIEFDDKLVKMVRDYDVSGLLNFDPSLAEEAGQDALWSIAILLGALDGLNVKREILSYEGPFGVGYMVARFDP
ncbi:MAG: AmmeMemoRadiSam system protein B [bacterium]|nr:AmmeMemoRadiSam system protein B [Candidatus Margulisiibacteriota bacterium]